MRRQEMQNCENWIALYGLNLFTLLIVKFHQECKWYSLNAPSGLINK